MCVDSERVSRPKYILQIKVRSKIENCVRRRYNTYLIYDITMYLKRLKLSKYNTTNLTNHTSAALYINIINIIYYVYNTIRLICCTIRLFKPERIFSVPIYICTLYNLIFITV